MTARWQDLAVCAGDERWTERRRAQQLADCADCPVRFQCLDQALTDEEAICRRAAEESNSHDPASHLSHLVASALPVYGGLPITDRVAILAGRFGARPTDVRQLPGEYASCGTYAGYQTHGKNGEQTCQACKDAQRAYQQERRAKHRADLAARAPAATRASCGTRAGYQAHQRGGELACGGCMQAQRVYHQARKASSA